MTLDDIKEWLKGTVQSPRWYVGKINANDKQCIGIYPTQGPAKKIPVGGTRNCSYNTKAVSILVHWGQDAVQAEAKAMEIYNILYGKRAIIDNYEVFMFDLRSGEPISVGTDDRGIYEYVINVVIYFKKER